MHKIQSRRMEFIDLNINEFVFTDIKLLMNTGKKILKYDATAEFNHFAISVIPHSEFQ